MDDIVPGLLNQMKSDFQKQYDGNSKIQELNEKLNTGTATYHEANEYAAEVGKITKKTYEKNISSEILPDGKMYYNIADRVIGSTEHDQYELVSEYTEQVQTDLNKKAGIGLKAQVPEEDTDRVEGLVNYASNADSYDDIAEGLTQGLESMALETVNKSVEKNADFQYKSGLQPKIVRNGGDCCEWCSQLLGRYDYPNVPDDVYRRHNNCTCTVEYDPGDGKRLQNVWNHNQWREATDEETLQNRKTVGLDNGDNSAKIRIRKSLGANKEPYLYGKRIRYITGNKTPLEYALDKSANVGHYPTYHIDDKQEAAIVHSEIFKYLPLDTPSGIIKSKAIGDYTYYFECLGGKEFRLIGREEIPDAVTGLFERSPYKKK